MAIGTNRSKLELNGQILINPAKVILGYGNPYIYFNVTFYATEMIDTLIQAHC